MKQVTRDLMDKAASDVTDALGRVVSICDGNSLAIVVGGVSGGLGVVLAEIERRSCKPPKPSNEITVEDVMTAALLVGRAASTGIASINDTKADIDALVEAGRIKRGETVL